MLFLCEDKLFIFVALNIKQILIEIIINYILM